MTRFRRAGLIERVLPALVAKKQRRRQALALAQGPSVLGAVLALLPWLLLGAIVLRLAQPQGPPPSGPETLAQRALLYEVEASFETLRLRNLADAYRYARGEWPTADRPAPFLPRCAPSPALCAARSREYYFAQRGDSFWFSHPRSDADPAEPDAHSRQTLVFDDNALAAALYGERESTLRALEHELGVQAHARGNQVRLIGPEERVRLARGVLEQLYGLLRGGAPLEPADVRAAIQAVSEQPGIPLREVYGDVLASVGGRRRITAKNLSQRRYLELLEQHDLVSRWPCRTGKDYLAMAMVSQRSTARVVRVILTRPAVEAGEKLGFLPARWPRR